MKRTVFFPELKLSFGGSRGLNVFVSLLLFAVFAGLAPAAHAATITVDSLLDTTAVDGECTLREAIENANNNAATNADCAAGTGADTITFNLSGTITLVSTLPNITDAVGLTIDGAGQTVTISGNNTVRVARVDTGASLTLNNLTIANGFVAGDFGGGINNSGTVTVTNSTFSGNSANSGYGGGIANFGSGGTVTVTNSTFSGNSANSGYGGGIANYSNGGTVTVTNSTFSGNSGTSGFGAAIANASIGGGTVTITNSTFNFNDVTGGGASAAISNGITAGTVTLRNTIVANSVGGGGNCSGTLTDGGNNLQFGGTVANSCGATIPTGDPVLGALANNGGPTQTMALGAGSAALDNIPNAGGCGFGITTDQRGVARPQPAGDSCDIGAYEFVAAVATVPVPVPIPAINIWWMMLFMLLAGLGSLHYMSNRT
ncbi:MAG: CSLREA domain-containing protein [Alcanivorax sp.]|jgi:CSLREA domain-containing protein